jgi:hypothetical protein
LNKELLGTFCFKIGYSMEVNLPEPWDFECFSYHYSPIKFQPLHENTQSIPTEKQNEGEIMK